MSFSISTRHFPSRWNFTSYAKAKQHHDDIKPTGDGYRPLNSNRRGPYYTRLGRDGAVELVCCSTAVVRVLPDDTMQLDLSHNSISTRLFADAFAPVSISAFRGTSVVSDESGEYITDKVTIDLKTNTIVEGKTRIEVQRVNRQRAKEPQRLIRTMLDWLNCAEAFDPEYQKRIKYSQGETRVDVTGVKIEDAETWVEQVLNPCIRRCWHGNLKAQLKKDVYTAYDAFDWELLPEGVLPPAGAEWRKTN